MTSQKVCLFCGGGPLTKEHVVPAWIRDILPMEGRVGVFRGGEKGQPAWTMASLNQEALIVCGPCNHGWMSRLEGHVKPVLAGAIVGGTKVSLTPARQQLVSTWAVKTSLVLMASMPSLRESYIPPEHVRALHQQPTLPPPGTQVWMFHLWPFVKGTQPFFRGAYVRSASLGRKPDDIEAYLTTFAIGHVGFQVFGRNIIKPDGLVLQAGTFWDDSVIPVWLPVLPSIEWPPTKTIAYETMGLLCSWGQDVAPL